MALSQLITTVDIPNNNIGIGEVVAAGKSDAIALGNGLNVGIGTNDPKAGIHVGKIGSTLPALYVENSTGENLPSVTTGDGMFSALDGVPIFTNDIGSKEIFTVAGRAMGTSTLAGGTVTVPLASVQPTSVIFLTRTSTTGDVTTIGTLSVIAGTGDFTVTSTVATDVGSFNYLVINV